MASAGPADASAAGAGSDEREEVVITSRDYWFKVTGMLQQNWALIERTESGATIYFIDDLSRVFDEMTFPSSEAAEVGLRRNGFRRFAEDEKAPEFLALPKPPFLRNPNSRRSIYSGGEFWK